MVCLTDFEEYAKEHLSKATWDYYAAGADECCTRDDNLLAYKRYGQKRASSPALFKQASSVAAHWPRFTGEFLPAEPIMYCCQTHPCDLPLGQIRRLSSLFIKVGGHIRRRKVVM